jgi:2-polyprenyl-6-hydroxyphenyl methylase/3-demethylubiquinone-9 3-methyltransferase
MAHSLMPVAPLVTPCKCCETPSRIYGVVDFNKNCEIVRGRDVLPFSAIPIYYHRCSACGLVFTVAMDEFSQEDFVREVYNEGYAEVDPDYQQVRPAANAQFVHRLFAQSRDIRILDYGGGNGRTTELLRESGFVNADMYDPLNPAASQRPQGPYDLIICFEVAEHSTQPTQTFSDIASLLTDEGMILFSTLLQPENIDQLALSWWYVAPRNGHVTIYSKASLVQMANKLGFTFASSGDNVHIFFRGLPDFAKHLLPSQARSA